MPHCMPSCRIPMESDFELYTGSTSWTMFELTWALAAADW